jgi:hypothetical protein
MRAGPYQRRRKEKGQVEVEKTNLTVKQMTIETITRRLVSPAMSLMLIVCFASVGRTQQTDHDILSTADKNELVASALRIAFGAPGPIRLALSSENIEFVDAARMSEMGFTLIDAGQVRKWEGSQFFLEDFVVFKRIASNDDVVSVVLSRITFSRACFSSAVVSRERQTFTLEFHKETGEWIGQLVYRSVLQFQRSNKLFAQP